MRKIAMVIALVVLGHIPPAAAQRWTDATARCVGTTAEWTNKVELADVDGDGNVDILLANGGDYATPGTPQPSRIFRNLGPGWDTAGSHCTEITADVFGGTVGLSRVIKAVDLDGDGDLDILTGGAYGTQLRLYKREGGGWIDATAQLPQQATSIGDIEVGDVDGDGDLDLLIAEWGERSPAAGNYNGGITRLYLNDGTGRFTDATSTHMPQLRVLWSWDVELVDVDGDWDLDALVSCKLCSRSLLFRNDGTGHFTDDPEAIPAAGNNYDFEAMDIDGDGDLDLVSVNDGGNLRERLLVNDGTGKFTDESARLGNANPPSDDNVAVWLDVDGDGDADLLVGTLGGGSDRLALNDGTGHFTLAPAPTPADTRGTLGLAVADLDGDGRLDVVQGQGEQAFGDKVQLAGPDVAIDTVPPAITAVAVVNGGVRARIHDHQTPSHAHDWRRVWVEHGGTETEMRWYGEFLWRADVTPAGDFRVCAVDRRGNQACASPS
ncbi:MAG: VCBS repeat-containing protein, partial [Deltaproteobacteria bacterium]|nr:VCBS repeat-containing protein [Deltaproteobacteria bacterium]